MNKRILYLYIFLFIFFADAYFIIPWLKPITIFSYLLIGLSFSAKQKKLDKNSRKLQYVFFLFIAYTFVVNLIQNDTQLAFSALLSTIYIPFVFGIFSRKEGNYKFLYFYAKWYVVYNGFFAVLQFLGVYVTAGELLAKLPFLSVDSGFAIDFSNQGLRISGASYSSIGFASTIGAIFLFIYFTKTKTLLNPKMRKIYLIILIFLIIMTQTRSIIYAMVPVIYLTNVFITGRNIKKLASIIVGLGFTVFIIILLLPTIQSAFPRLFLNVEEDGSVIHRIQANVYGVVGTFYTSPIIGMPKESSLDAMDIGYNKLGLFLGDRYIDEVTQHNQPSYFFRYYGIIGFLFFILIYRAMFKISLSKSNPEFMKKILFSILIFHLLYTFSHNNKITGDIYIWFFMALNFRSTIFIKKLNEEKVN